VTPDPAPDVAVFESDATDLAYIDDNGTTDVFVSHVGHIIETVSASTHNNLVTGNGPSTTNRRTTEDP
jgi:hypothetical protein